MSSRSSRRKRRTEKIADIQSVPSPSVYSRLWAMLDPTGKVLAALGLLLAISGTYYTLNPKLTITATGALDPLNPYSTPFVIKNESVLPLYDIDPEWHYRTMSSENNSGLNNSKFINNIVPVPTLSPGESTSIFMPTFIHFGGKAGRVKYIDVSVTVKFRPFIPVPMSKGFRFVTVRTSDKAFHWLSKAISE